ncbi:MAG TPA: hypothetical protein VND22_05670 [Actinomycetota bacterium]|nr:hypothetical protein [Actinomycetota bacterium]
MERSPGGWAKDPFGEEYLPRKTRRTPGPFFDLDEDDFPAEAGWITGTAMCEMFALQLLMAAGSPYCPRCESWMFTYGELHFCSHGCPENMRSTRASD